MKYSEKTDMELYKCKYLRFFTIYNCPIAKL